MQTCSKTYVQMMDTVLFSIIYIILHFFYIWISFYFYIFLVFILI